MKNLFGIIILCVSAVYVANAQIASGGNYTLDQTVIASGGGTSGGSNFKVEGTTGQSSAGTRQQNFSHSFQPGFWTAQPFAPTAASVTVGGRILTANGSGIRNVRIIMTNASGETQTAISTTFGYFRFEDVLSGETYIFSVSARKFIFSQPAQVRSIFEETNDIIFTAENEFQEAISKINVADRQAESRF